MRQRSRSRSRMKAGGGKCNVTILSVEAVGNYAVVV
jgi:DUF971 family protein